MKMIKLLAAALTAAALCVPASAAILTSSTGAAVTDYSTPALVSFDLDLADFSSTRLHFVIEEGDLLSPLNLNAIVRNLSGLGLQRFTFTLDGISFAAPGSVKPTFGTLDSVNTSASAAAIAFGTPEYAEFHFGNPFALGNSSNWLFDVAGLRAGDSFSITATVPEPGTLTMMLASLAMFSFAIRNRDKH